MVSVRGKDYRSHRLAWKYMTGSWPASQIDHRDLNKKNNRWNNLREATNSQNKQNAGVRCDSLSGVKGVRQEKNGRWGARIYHAGKSHWLGLCNTKEEAAKRYAEKAQQYFGEFARYD